MQIAKIGKFDCILNDHDDCMIAKTILYITQEQMMAIMDGLSTVNPYIDAKCTIHATKKNIAEGLTNDYVVHISGTDMWAMVMGVQPSEGIAQAFGAWGGQIIAIILKGVDEE